MSTAMQAELSPAWSGSRFDGWPRSAMSCPSDHPTVSRPNSQMSVSARTRPAIDAVADVARPNAQLSPPAVALRQLVESMIGVQRV